MEKLTEKDRPALLPSPNHFEKRFGKNIHPRDMEKITRILQGFMAELRQLLGISTTRLREVGCDDKTVGRECQTCAFKQSTDHMNGFVGTTYGLVWTFLEPKERRFLCHAQQEQWEDNQFDPTKRRLCNGFGNVSVVSAKLARKRAVRALKDIRIVFASRLKCLKH